MITLGKFVGSDIKNIKSHSLGDNKMHHNLKISVIMSVYNGEKYIKEAVESVLNQTFSDFEFIIVNDGSTDSFLWARMGR